MVASVGRCMTYEDETIDVAEGQKADNNFTGPIVVFLPPRSFKSCSLKNVGNDVVVGDLNPFLFSVSTYPECSGPKLTGNPEVPLE